MYAVTPSAGADSIGELTKCKRESPHNPEKCQKQRRREYVHSAIKRSSLLKASTRMQKGARYATGLVNNASVAAAVYQKPLALLLGRGTANSATPTQTPQNAWMSAKEKGVISLSPQSVSNGVGPCGDQSAVPVPTRSQRFLRTHPTESAPLVTISSLQKVSTV